MRLVSGDCLYRGWLHSHWLVVILATVQYTRHSVHQHRLNKIHYTVKWVTTLVPVLQYPPSLSSNSLSLPQAWTILQLFFLYFLLGNICIVPAPFFQSSTVLEFSPFFTHLPFPFSIRTFPGYFRYICSF